jgi:hypothetical protein
MEGRIKPNLESPTSYALKDKVRLPGGTCTHCKAPPLQGAHRKRKSDTPIPLSDTTLSFGNLIA